MKKLILVSAFLFSVFSIKAQNPVGIFDDHADIGALENTGSASYDAAKRKYTLTGSGNNMWFKRDEFHYMWKNMKGDFIITTQPTLVGDTGDPHKKTGIIVRTGLDTASAMVCLTVHLDGLVTLQFRIKDGVNTQEIKIPMVAAEVLNLERRGRSYFASVAKLGQPFWSVELPDIDFPEELMVGLFVCSHNPKIVEQATFTNTRLFSALR